MGQREFGEAVRRALGERTIQSLADEFDVPHSTMSTWLTRKAPEPDMVFAIEASVGAEPGHLSAHLGYLPVAAVPEMSVVAAVDADPSLTPAARAITLAAYRAAREALGGGDDPADGGEGDT